jgi:pimeloyl-ACP methyl ester carboxylesterase
MVAAAPTKFEQSVGPHRLSFLRAGKGAPVLLVHGITTYSFLWRNIIPGLSDAFDVIAPDLLGCGDSDKPLDVSYALRDHADRLRDFIVALGLRRVHYVGHDLGGGIGQILAVRYPDLISSLTMVNTVAYDFWPVQPIIAMRTPIIRQFMMAAVDIGAFTLIVRRGLYHKERATPELMAYFMKPMRTTAGRKAFLHFAHCLDNRDLTSIAAPLRRLRIPVLIVRGDADVYLSPRISERLLQEIAASRLVRVATAGHFIQEDEPTWLTHTVAGFLEESRGR